MPDGLVSNLSAIAATGFGTWVALRCSMVRLKFVLESLSTTLYPLKTGKALAIADIHGVIVVPAKRDLSS
ncbi:hypothetical protein SCLCIDRAFT_1212754 [Scleroderma citrinum Foug A]|uniref:Uncharacterized protein n=1 Tax=Scleroderma citrinum Foug A TaxID=1036808 RepID=A0A0C3DWW8_9AGAM|nr:hypothetical protein SCLCIDRAFT_1212754 [Scleroderma citrinum Foug A]